MSARHVLQTEKPFNRPQAEKLLMAETHAKMRTVALMQSNARAGITGIAYGFVCCCCCRRHAHDHTPTQLQLITCAGVEAPTTAGSLVYANQRAELLQVVSSVPFYNCFSVILLQHEQQQQGLIQSRRTSHAIANGRSRTKRSEYTPCTPRTKLKPFQKQTSNPFSKKYLKPLSKANFKPLFKNKTQIPFQTNSSNPFPKTILEPPINSALQQRYFRTAWQRGGRTAEDVADQEEVGGLFEIL